MTTSPNVYPASQEERAEIERLTTPILIYLGTLSQHAAVSVCVALMARVLLSCRYIDGSNALDMLDDHVTPSLRQTIVANLDDMPSASTVAGSGTA